MVNRNDTPKGKKDGQPTTALSNIYNQNQGWKVRRLCCPSKKVKPLGQFSDPELSDRRRGQVPKKNSIKSWLMYTVMFLQSSPKVTCSHLYR